MTARQFESGLQPTFTQSTDADYQVGDPDSAGIVTVEGYAARYGNWFPAGQGDGVEARRMNRPGMFRRALEQNPDIVLRVNHGDALARTGAGTLQVWEDDQGLRFRGQVNTNTTAGADVVQNMRDKLITQGSVRYWPTDIDEYTERDGGKLVLYQDIRSGRIDKGDVSLVVHGMNPECSTTLSQMASLADNLPTPGRDAMIEAEAATTPAEQSGPVEPSDEAASASQAARERARALVRVNENRVAADAARFRG